MGRTRGHNQTTSRSHKLFANGKRANPSITGDVTLADFANAELPIGCKRLSKSKTNLLPCPIEALAPIDDAEEDINNVLGPIEALAVPIDDAEEDISCVV